MDLSLTQTDGTGDSNLPPVTSEFTAKMSDNGRHPRGTTINYSETVAAAVKVRATQKDDNEYDLTAKATMKVDGGALGAVLSFSPDCE